jgi:hypothetical protein
VRSDGAPLIAIARQKRADAEKDLISAETRVDQLRESGAETKPELKEELNGALKAVRDCERLVDIATDELDKYYSDYEEDVISIHDDDSEPEVTEEPPTKIQRLGVEGEDVEADDDDDDVVEETENTAEVNKTDNLLCGIYHDVKLSVAASGNHRDDSTAAMSATSDVTGADNPDVLFTQCPQLKAVGCLLVELNPGEMLYLPASWLCQITTWDDEHVDQPQQTSVLEAGDSLLVDKQINETLSQNTTDVGTKPAAKLIEANEGLSELDNVKATESLSTTEVPHGTGTTRSEVTASETVKGDIVEDKNIVAVAVGGDEPVKASRETVTQEAATSKQSVTTSRVTSSGQSLGYLAVNYWFHPPDNDIFEQPYRHDFWLRRWQRIETEVKRTLKKSVRNVSDVISLDSSDSSTSENDYSDSSEYGEESSDGGEDEEYDTDPDSTPVFLSEKASTGQQPLVGGMAAGPSAARSSGGLSKQSIKSGDGSSSAILVGDDSDSDDDVNDDDEEDDEDVEWDTAVGANDSSSVVICDEHQSFQTVSAVARPSNQRNTTSTACADNNTKEDIIIMDDDEMMTYSAGRHDSSVTSKSHPVTTDCQLGSVDTINDNKTSSVTVQSDNTIIENGDQDVLKQPVTCEVQHVVDNVETRYGVVSGSAVCEGVSVGSIEDELTNTTAV